MNTPQLYEEIKNRRAESKFLRHYFVQKILQSHARRNRSISSSIPITIETGLSYNAIKEGLHSRSLEYLRFLKEAFGPNGPPFVVNHNGGSGQYLSCILCYESNIQNIILEPCKHDRMCDRCLERLQFWKCPLCDVDIQNAIVCA